MSRHQLALPLDLPPAGPPGGLSAAIARAREGRSREGTSPLAAAYLADPELIALGKDLRSWIEERPRGARLLPASADLGPLP